MRKTFFLMWMLAAAAFAPMVVCSGPPEHNRVKAGLESGNIRTIIVFGDSIVAGYEVQEGWPDIMGHELAKTFPRVEVINAGHNGDTSAKGLGRIERDVLDHDPDLVLISFGLNDMRKKIAPVKFKIDMTAMVDKLLEKKVEVVLLTTIRLARGAGFVIQPDLYNDVIREIAAEKQVVMLDIFRESSGLNTPEYLLDVVHPNEKGHRRLAEITINALLR